MTPVALRRARHPDHDAVPDGQMASMKVGAMPKQKILEWLAETGVAATSRRLQSGEV